MPSITVRRIVEAPRQEVWDVIADIENAGRWNRGWQHIEVLSYHKEGRGVTFRARSEDGAISDLEIVAWSPPESIAFAPRREASEGGYGVRLESQAFHLRAVSASQTELELTATASTSGLRGWFVGRLFWPGYQSPGLGRALEAIAALFSPGSVQTRDRESG